MATKVIESPACIEANGVSAALAPAKDKVSAVVIATRNEIAAAGIEALLLRDGYIVAARCWSEDDLLHSSQAYRPDIIVLAQDIIKQGATKTILPLRARNRSVAIIFLLEERDATIADLLALPVEGILLKSSCAANFSDCVESVHHGRKWVDPDLLRYLTVAAELRPQIASILTSREAEIALLVSQGLNNKKIARDLDLTEGTVKTHLHHIYRKLGICSRTQLALSIARQQLASLVKTAVSRTGFVPIPPGSTSTKHISNISNERKTQLGAVACR